MSDSGVQNNTNDVKRPDVVTSLEKSTGFVARHWKLVMVIGLCIVLAPLIGVILKIIVGVAGGIGDFGKAISDLLGPIANYLGAMSDKCKKTPGSWDCWLFQIASFVLPVFGLVIAKWRRGTASSTVETIAALENKPETVVGQDLATPTRDKANAISERLSPDTRAKPEVQTLIVRYSFEQVGAAALTEAQVHSTDPITEQNKQYNEDVARNRQASDDAARDVTDDDKREVESQSGPRPIPRDVAMH